MASSSPISVGTLFLGGGNAAGYFAAEFENIVSADPTLKDSAFGGSLAIVSGEEHISYERPALSKAYLAPKSPARLPGFHTCVGGGGERLDSAFYETKGIRYLLGSKATSVDAAAQTVTLADGTVLKYKKLVIATGARPVDLAKDFKMPGAVEGGGAPNVLYLRSVADADRLYAALERAGAADAAGSASPGARPLVIGGGYIGLELAAALVNWGLKPVVAFPEDRLLARILTPDAAAFYSKFFQLRGAELRPGVSVKALDKEEGGDGTVASALLSDGTSVATSLVVVGVGARPSTELFEGEGSKIAVVKGPPGGVAVDARLRSVSAPEGSVWACGDVAAFPKKCLHGGAAKGDEEEPTRQEHVQHARTSAAFVARDVAAGDSASAPPYSYLPYYYSRIFDLGWVFYGSQGAESVEFGSRDAEAAARGEKQTFGTFHLEEVESDGDLKGKRKKIVGAFLEGGSPEQNAVVKKLVEVGADVDDEGGKTLGIEWASAKVAKL